MLRRVPGIAGRSLVLRLLAPYSNPRGVLQMAPLPSAGKPTSAEGTSGCRETDGALQPGPWACLNLPSPGLAPHERLPELPIMGPLGTPLGLSQWKKASSRVEAGTSGFLSNSDSDRSKEGTGCLGPAPGSFHWLPRRCHQGNPQNRNMDLPGKDPLQEMFLQTPRRAGCPSSLLLKHLYIFLSLSYSYQRCCCC